MIYKSLAALIKVKRKKIRVSKIQDKCKIASDISEIYKMIKEYKKFNHCKFANIFERKAFT